MLSIKYLPTPQRLQFPSSIGKNTQQNKANRTIDEIKRYRKGYKSGNNNPNSGTNNKTYHKDNRVNF